MGFKATFLKILGFTPEYLKNEQIYEYGENNLYPYEAAAYKNASVTAISASDWMVRLMVGKGFDKDANTKLISDGYSFYRFLRNLSRSLADNNGVYVHVDYDENFKPCAFEVLPFWTCRVGWIDSRGFTSKIHYSTDWTKGGKNTIVYDSFNPVEDVVRMQVEKSGGINQYKGQVYYYNRNEEYVYPQNRLHACFDEADNEKKIGKYKNTILTRGFFGKTLIVTRPLVGRLDPDASKEERDEHRAKESEYDEFNNMIQESLGAENVSGALHLQMDFDDGKLEDQIIFKNIESNINPDLFQKIGDDAVKKILTAYNNLPLILVEPQSGSSLGSTGTAIYEAKLLYQENTHELREDVEQIFNYLWSFHSNSDGVWYSIVKLIDKKVETTNE